MDEQLKKALRIPEDIEVSFDAVDWQRINQSAYPKDMRRLREMYMQVYAGNKYLMTAKFHQNKEIEKEVYTYLLTSAVFGYQTAPVMSCREFIRLNERDRYYYDRADVVVLTFNREQREEAAYVVKYYPKAVNMIAING